MQLCSCATPHFTGIPRRVARYSLQWIPRVFYSIRDIRDYFRRYALLKLYIPCVTSMTTVLTAASAPGNTRCKTHLRCQSRDSFLKAWERKFQAWDNKFRHLGKTLTSRLVLEVRQSITWKLSCHLKRYRTTTIHTGNNKSLTRLQNKNSTRASNNISDSTWIDPIHYGTMS